MSAFGSPFEASNAVAARFYNLRVHVTKEIEALEGAMKQLQEQNRQMRERLELESYKQKHKVACTVVDVDQHFQGAADEEGPDASLDANAIQRVMRATDRLKVCLDKESFQVVMNATQQLKASEIDSNGESDIKPLVDVSREPMLQLVEDDDGDESERLPSLEKHCSDPSDEPGLTTSDKDSEDSEASSSGQHSSAQHSSGFGSEQPDVEPSQEPETKLSLSSASSASLASSDAPKLLRSDTSLEDRRIKRQRKSVSGRSRRTTKLFQRLPHWCRETDMDRPSHKTSVGPMTDVSGGTEKKFKMLVELMEEQKASGQSCCCESVIQPYMIPPQARFSIALDVASVTMIAYDCIAVPLLLLESSERDDYPVTVVMTWVSRVFWTLSVPRSFLTGFLREDGTIETRAAAVFREYRNSWLVLDLIIVVLDWVDVLIASESAVGSVRIVRLLKAARLARMIQIPTLIERMSPSKSEMMFLYLSITKSTVSYIILNHFLACIWYWVGTLTDHGWVSELGIEEKSIMHKYMYSIHWSASQFIGSTEVFPSTGLERAFGSLIMIFAFICSASFISKITAAMTRLQILAGKTRELFSSLRRFLVHSNLSAQLRMRVLSAAKHNLALKDHNQSEADVELLRYLSEPMLIEIHHEVYSNMLMHHPFFKYYNHFEPLAVQKLCHSAVAMLTLGVGDVLFTQGVESTHPCMLFPQQGTLLYMKDLDGDGEIDLDEMIQVMHPMWICEPVLWMKWIHMGYLRAAQHSSVLQLGAEQFGAIVQEFKNTNYPSEYAAMIVDRLNEISHYEDVDDLCESIDVKDLTTEVFPALAPFGSRASARQSAILGDVEIAFTRRFSSKKPS